MKKTLIINCLCTIILLSTGCKKEAETPKLEAENTTITGNMTYKQTGLKVLTAAANGSPITVEISMDGIGTLNIVGEITMKSTFVFDFSKGEGKDFNSVYTDTNGNTIKMGGTSKAATGKEWAVYATESAISGTGRFTKITTTSGGTSGATMKQDGTGTGRIEWTMTF
jgi:hypothetical protein